MSGHLNWHCVFVYLSDVPYRETASLTLLVGTGASMGSGAHSFFWLHESISTWALLQFVE